MDIKKYILKWEASGIVFVFLMGALLHFVFEWSGEPEIVGLFASVNESVWEHSKLTFSPMLIAGIFQIFAISPTYLNHYFAILASVLVGIVLMPILYYFVKSITKKEILWISITIFYIVVISAYLVEYCMLRNRTILMNYDLELISFCLIFVLILIYAVLTFAPPRLGIFKDTIKKKYGDFK